MLPIFAQGAVWIERYSWDDAWELRYSQWVQDRITLDAFTENSALFQGSGPDFGLDCADVMYAMRAAFSYFHGLPFAFHRKTDARLDSNRTTRFDAISNQSHQRFLAFLRYVIEMGSTYTLRMDSYPVEITPRAIVPGSFFLIYAPQRKPELRHTKPVVRNLDIGSLVFFESSHARARHRLELKEKVGLPYWQPDNNDGFRRFRRMDRGGSMVPAERHPDYNLEQYGPAFEAGPHASFKQKVRQRLISGSAASEEALLSEEVESVCADLRERAWLVQEAAAYVVQNGPISKNTALDDIYSTPARDHIIATALRGIRTLPLPREVINASLQGCRVEILPGIVVPLTELEPLFLEEKISSDPNDSPEKRWGVSSYEPEENQPPQDFNALHRRLEEVLHHRPRL